jgi:hypothetical protein
LGYCRQSHQRGQQSSEVARIDRLSQIVIDRGERFGNELVLLVKSSHGNQDHIVTVERSQLVRQLTAIATGHVNVQQDAMRSVPLDNGKRLGAIACDRDLIPVEFQVSGQDLGRVSDVIHDNDSHFFTVHDGRALRWQASLTTV